jgi:hypothetical protein
MEQRSVNITPAELSVEHLNCLIHPAGPDGFRAEHMALSYPFPYFTADPVYSAAVVEMAEQFSRRIFCDIDYPD